MNNSKSYHLSRLMQFFWIVQLAIIVLLRELFADANTFMIATLCWTAVCAAGIICHQFSVLNDNNWFAMPILFFIPYWLVFYSIPLRLSIDRSYVSDKPHLIASQYWPDVVFLASLGIVCFMIGYSYFSQKQNKHSPYIINQDRHEKKTLYYASWMLLIASFISFVAFMASGGQGLYEGGYVHVTHLSWITNVASIAFQSSFRAAVCAWALYIIIYDKMKISWIVPVCVLSLMVSAMVLSGDRGLLSWTLICVMVVLSQKKPIKWHTLLLVLLSASVIFAFVRSYRMLQEKSINEALYTIQQDEYWLLSGLTSFAEDNAPTATNAFAVVEERGHVGGVFFGQGILSVIPFYSQLLPWLPASKDRAMHNTGSYVTNYVFGYHAYGLATTIVTDLYIDFPIPIVMLLMVIYGSIAGILYQKRFSGSHAIGLFFYAVFVPGFMYSVRADYFSSIRLLWAVLAYLVAIKVAKLLLNNTLRRIT